MDDVLQSWQPITQNEQLVRFVSGMFHRLGVKIEETGEAFVVDQSDGRVTLRPDEPDLIVDFIVQIDRAQARRLAEEAARPQLSEVEKFRVMRELFTAATAATLARPRLASPLLRRLTGAEQLIHVRLISPTPDEPDATHTLIYAAGQWLVISGLHGRAQRRFEMTVDQAAEFQKQVSRVLRSESLATWISFGQWYRRWRRGTSTTRAA